MNLAFHAFALSLIAIGFVMFVLYIVELWSQFYKDWKDAGARAARRSQRNGRLVESQSPLRDSRPVDLYDQDNEGE
jgi:hypothetical protein